ncbi:ArsR family transcriptional regulator [Sporosarcina sp. PTS2304]|uniref:ArsR/SmtB family transcription factor n=1 Tax=Sporosarcina sp. PTS2304 TaxID=2283194 RepID=UPI000E0DB667|nr:metalloregulator ArsR/SmtB family transcription factor [Sporosarcina sp. PTS2304]AXH99865.1 ArsR family transcriptional regulator [Sporosarcina sp. PTS2304]
MEAAALERYLKTVGDQSRLRLLKALEGGSLCICDLQSVLAISQPAVSQHMHRLKKDGIVRDEKRGRWVYWSIHTEHPQYKLLVDLLQLLPAEAVDRSEDMSCK